MCMAKLQNIVLCVIIKRLEAIASHWFRGYFVKLEFGGYFMTLQIRGYFVKQ